MQEVQLVFELMQVRQEYEHVRHVEEFVKGSYSPESQGHELLVIVLLELAGQLVQLVAREVHVRQE